MKATIGIQGLLDFALTGINPEQNAKESFHDVTG